MKVEFDGKTYAIEFHYWNIGIDATDCLIRDLSTPSPGDGTAPVVAQGTALRYYKDRPDREKARKAALKKAICGYDKPTRRLSREAYLGRKRKAA